jgi:hypothetical protein
VGVLCKPGIGKIAIFLRLKLNRKGFMREHGALVFLKQPDYFKPPVFDRVFSQSLHGGHFQKII